MSKRTEKSVAKMPECKFESGELGNSVEHAKAVSAQHSAEVDESLGMQMISIRLPKSLIEDLKYLASREGLGYQPLMRRVLMRYATGEYKTLAREEFSRRGSNSPVTSSVPEEDYDEPLAACG